MNVQFDLTTNYHEEGWLQNTSVPDKPLKDILVSDAALYFIENIMNGWFSLFVCILGSITNTVEIVVFAKLGFKETINISMTFISFWDLIRVVTGGGHRLYAPLMLISPSFGKIWQTYTLMNLHYLHIISSNVSYMLGAYVAVERCLCVSVPFTVKTILTLKLTTTMCATISAVVFISFFPIFLAFEPKWIYSDQSNSSILIYQFSEFYKTYGVNYQEVNRSLGALYPILSLATMVTSTILISYHLQKALNFRHGLSQKYTKTMKQQTMSKKEKQVVKMLLVIINIYIINIMPRVGGYLGMLFEPEFYLLRFYNNVFWVIMYIIFALDFLNSSVHLFVFYFMSSKFRKTFDSIFRANTGGKKEHIDLVKRTVV